MLNKDIDKLQKVIEYKFNNLKVLVVAMTHKSYASQFSLKDHNERMEFLGDSILAMIIVEHLYKKFPNKSEGKLSQMKSQIVSAQNLCAWAKRIDLGSFIDLSKGEDTQEARERENLLCDVFEALIGAIYLDGGFESAKRFVLKFLNVQEEVILTDYKSRLQEYAQLKFKELPVYKTLKEYGPDHDKNFEVVVYVKKEILGSGVGHSKKEAQQSAAQKAMQNIKRK